MPAEPWLAGADPEARLAALQAEYDVFRYHLPDALIEAEVPGGRLTYMNDMAELLLGYSQEDLAAGINGWQLLDEEGLAVIGGAIAKHLAESVGEGRPYERRPVQELYQVTMVRKDGTTFPAEGQGSYVTNADGVPVLVRIMLRDESERIAADAAFREMEGRLEIALQGGDLGLFEADLATGTVRVLHAASTLGLSALDGEGQPTSALFGRVHPDDHAGVERALASHLAGAREWFEAEMRLRAEDDGGWTWVFVRARVTARSDDGEAASLAGTVVDTSRLRRAEEDRERAETVIRDAQRLESIGTLAAGVAHDFNNLLTAITGNLFLLGEAIPKDDADAQESVREALHAAERGAEVARRLLEFGRPAAGRREGLSLDELVSEALHLARAWDAPGVQVVVTNDGSPDEAWGDPTGVEQALLNLMINALDAIDGAGRLEVHRARMRVTATDSLGRTGVAPGEYQAISVRDSGPGIPAEVRARIFDPFYTTKAVGKGTGLGLWTALGTARSHGGWLDCQSKAGQGAQFRLILPVEGQRRS